MGDSITIHANPALSHQVRIAEALALGFCRLGLPVRVSDDPAGAAELHIVLGPWFALKQWRYDNTFYIDRAYWGDPDRISCHWLKDGEKRRDAYKEIRRHPEIDPHKHGTRAIYLCDYGEKPRGAYHSVRYHPAERKPEQSLAEDLAQHQIAIGRRTTALVDACFKGLSVVTDDPHSPVYDVTDRTEWARGLAWHNWSLDEIARGEMWHSLQ